MTKTNANVPEDEFKPAADAGRGQEAGEDAGDRPQPTQAGTEDEVID